SAPGGGWSRPRTGFSAMSLLRSDSWLRTPPARSQLDARASSSLILQSEGEGFVDIAGEIRDFIREANAESGVATLYLRHTSASLTIQDSADPDVLSDLTTALQTRGPVDGGWRHGTEGPDDMPADIKTMLTATSLQIPV